MPDTTNSRKVIYSAMQMTGKLHLGNYEGALRNWVRLQDEYEFYAGIVDLHSLTTTFDDTSSIVPNVRDAAIDYLAAGLDPEVTPIVVQSCVPAHSELHVLLSMITPLGLAGARAHLQGEEGAASHRHSLLRIARLPGTDGRRHPRLPRQRGAGGTGPGAAPGADARDRAPLQPPLWRRLPRVRGAAHRVRGAAGARRAEDEQVLRQLHLPLRHRGRGAGEGAAACSPTPPRSARPIRAIPRSARC